MNEMLDLQTTDLLPYRNNPKLSNRDKTHLIAMLKAISHPMRFEILQFLLTHPNCYTKDVVDHLPISQATVSQHIKQLREAGWVASEAKCQMTCHWLDEANITWFKQVVGDTF